MSFWLALKTIVNDSEFNRSHRMFTKVYKHNVYADGLSLMLLTTLIAFFIGEIRAVQGLEYIGCFRDKRERDLSVSHEKNLRNNTPETCVDSCLANNTLYAGVQNSDECYCGNTYGKYGQYGQDWCKFRCTGDKMKMCGGSWANNIYATGKKLTCDYRVTCSSDSGLQKECPLHGVAHIFNATVTKINCGPGRFISDWNVGHFCGWRGSILWVKNGCYVEFNLCYIRLGIPSTTMVTTRPPTSSLAARFTTMSSETTTSNTANTIISRTTPTTSSTTVSIPYNVSSVTLSSSVKQHNLTNTSPSPSYTTQAHLTEPDNTTTVVILVTLVLVGVCIAVLVVIIVCRKRHSRKDKGVPLKEETMTSAVYSNTMELNQIPENMTENSDRCNDVYEEANDAILDDYKHVREDTSENEYSIEELQEDTQEDKSKYSYSQAPTSEAQDIYSNANDLDETNLDINNVESDTEYNTISKVPQKPIADPDYDRLGMPDQDNTSKDEDYYCHTTETSEATATLKRLNRSVVDYSHVTFNDGKTETVDSAV